MANSKQKVFWISQWPQSGCQDQSDFYTKLFFSIHILNMARHISWTLRQLIVCQTLFMRVWVQIVYLDRLDTFFCSPVGSCGRCRLQELSVKKRMANTAWAIRIIVTRKPYMLKKNLLLRAIPTKAVMAVTITKIPTAPKVKMNLQEANQSWSSIKTCYVLPEKIVAP